MKKRILLGAIIGSFVGIFLSNLKAQKTVVNREVELQNGGKMLLGKQTLDQFHKEPYSNWFQEEYDSYVLDEPTLKELKKAKLSRYQITAFVGSWCPDTHREFPRFIKILEALKYPTNKLEIIAVSRRKESPEGEEVAAHLKNVPTFIIKRYNNELGRIVESPESGYLEKDLLGILEAQRHSKKEKNSKETEEIE